jgi:superfamily I DNA/RNA helicase
VKRLTDQQNRAVDLFCGGGDLRVVAFAGAGKTHTLAAMAQETRGPALYLAFNRSIAQEARTRFPQGTRCSTIHGIAFQAMLAEFGAEKLTGRLTTSELIEMLELRDRPVAGGDVSDRAQAWLVRATLERFLHGVDPEPRPAHVPLDGALARAAPNDRVELVEATVAGARWLWAQMVDHCNPVPLGHDGYLKLWAMRAPVLDADHILLDEAQDTNPVVLDLLRRQDAQLVCVGDPHQQIYGWRGAVDMMRALPGATSIHLTRSFRFGNAIADAANRVLASLGETRPIVANHEVTSTLGYCAPQAVIARTNAGVVDAVLDALMIGERPHVAGGTAELSRLLVDVDRLKQGRGADSSDLIGFSRWSDVVEASYEPGSGLRTLVALVEDHGEERLLAALTKAGADEAGADVVVTTAHKAKGREWDRVQLRGDFTTSGDPNDRGIEPAEARLFYVALTRARHAVDLPDDLMVACVADRAEDRLGTGRGA